MERRAAPSSVMSTLTRGVVMRTRPLSAAVRRPLPPLRNNLGCRAVGREDGKGPAAASDAAGGSGGGKDHHHHQRSPAAAGPSAGNAAAATAAAARSSSSKSVGGGRGGGGGWGGIDPTTSTTTASLLSQHLGMVLFSSAALSASTAVGGARVCFSLLLLLRH